MFKNVSNILGQITPKQRIVALLMVLLTITLVLTGPQLIKSLRTVPTEYLELVDEQNKKIQTLSSQIIILNEDVVEQSRQCTNRIIERENEIAIMVGDLIEYNKRKTHFIIDEGSRMDTVIQLPDNTMIDGLNNIYDVLTKKR